ncbi:glutathione transferase GstA [Pantoea sp. 1.19]|uniref:glutathione transferase GstA n=1 Tax=Pantoea sp. 1.19 TaxID=1925589 RepID=UPI0009491506|nr:glutathione transferase GstA [Pantoea sp. 1.19]
MKLYASPGLCSLSPHIVLREAGLDFTLVMVDIQTKKTERGEDYRRINPKGQVPALLLDDGTVLTEGTAIVQYLADRKPDRQLLAPVNTPCRYQTLAWLNYIATELHKSFTPLYRPETPETLKALVRQQLADKFRWVDAQLGGKSWLMGMHFSIADAYLFTVTRWTASLGIDVTALPHLSAWMARVAARPAVQAALSAEGLA